MTAILREDPPDVSRDSRLAPAALEPRHPPLPREATGRALPVGARPRVRAAGAVRHDDAERRERASRRGGLVAVASRRLPIVPVAAALVLTAAAFFAGRALRQSRRRRTALPLAFQQITDEAGVESDPAISPDGASVAFARRPAARRTFTCSALAAATRSRSPGNPRAAKPRRRSLPDGASIAFHEGGARAASSSPARRASPSSRHRFRVSSRMVTGWAAHRVLHRGNRTPTGRSSVSPLWVVDAKGGAPTKLFDGDAVQPAWSPSGARIAYWAVDTGQRDIYTIPAAGGPRTAVTHDAALDWGPRWSPDGRYLYFSSDRGGSMNIWRIAIDEATGVPAARPNRSPQA